MGDEQYGFIFNTENRVHDRFFGLVIETSGCFIQNQQLGILINCSCQCNALPLSPGDSDAFFTDKSV